MLHHCYSGVDWGSDRHMVDLMDWGARRNQKTLRLWIQEYTSFLMMPVLTHLHHL